MFETRRLKNVVIFIQTILRFVLSRNRYVYIYIYIYIYEYHLYRLYIIYIDTIYIDYINYIYIYIPYISNTIQIWIPYVSIHSVTNVIIRARFLLKQMWRLTKTKTEMKSEHWTKRWNWSRCTTLALSVSWTHGPIALVVRASERSSVVMGSNPTQANFL